MNIQTLGSLDNGVLMSYFVRFSHDSIYFSGTQSVSGTVLSTIRCKILFVAYRYRDKYTR